MHNTKLETTTKGQIRNLDGQSDKVSISNFSV